jgi:hypothetical protein
MPGNQAYLVYKMKSAFRKGKPAGSGRKVLHGKAWWEWV